MDLGLQGKVVAVTGGASGIGRATAMASMLRGLVFIEGDPELKAIVSQLVAKGVPRGDDFTEALPGTREERRGAVRLYERVD